MAAPREGDRRRPAVPQHPGRRWGWIFAGVWLLYLLYPVSAMLDEKSGLAPWQQFAGVVTTIVFAALYLTGLRTGFGILACGGTPTGRQRLVPAALVAIGLLMTTLTGSAAATYLVFAGVSVIMMFSWRVALPYALVAVVWVTTLPILLHEGGLNFTALFTSVITYALMFGVRRMQRQEGVIRQAHEDLADMAVTAERARFSRDLHDIVGHSLTAIVVKAELARKLAARDPAAVSAELADIEELARASLQDVRRTVAGYREVTLAGELASARSVLDAAGIAADLPPAVDEVPGELRELFGWVVREGVTNVVRHSGAGRCHVVVTPVSVEVRDDGQGGASGSGTGLTGLRERVAAFDGTVEAGPRPDGGFSLLVTVPGGGAPGVREREPERRPAVPVRGATVPTTGGSVA